MRFKKGDIIRLKKGEEEAFKLLVNTFSKKLFAYAISLTGNHSLAKDIVQEVFISTYEFRNKIDPNYSIQSFLYKTAYNKFINKYYEKKAEDKLKEKYLRTLNSLMDQTIQNENFELHVKRIEKSIDELPEKCKQIFKLSKKEGLTNIEIADYLQISIKTVEAQISIAFSKIRKDLLNK